MLYYFLPILAVGVCVIAAKKMDKMFHAMATVKNAVMKLTPIPEADFHGPVYAGLFAMAMERHRANDHETSERIVRLLLTNPNLDEWRLAGCHLILARGTQDYVKHARLAIGYYLKINTAPTKDSTIKESYRLSYRRRLLHDALKTYKRATHDFHQGMNIRDDKIAEFRKRYGRTPFRLERAAFDVVRVHDTRYPVGDAAYERYLQTGIDEGVVERRTW